MVDTSAITVDAVREQLRLLGHHDVPDDIISQFLNDLNMEAPGASPQLPPQIPMPTAEAATPVPEAEPPLDISCISSEGLARSSLEDDAVPSISTSAVAPQKGKPTRYGQADADLAATLEELDLSDDEEADFVEDIYVQHGFASAKSTQNESIDVSPPPLKKSAKGPTKGVSKLNMAKLSDDDRPLIGAARPKTAPVKRSALRDHNLNHSSHLPTPRSVAPSMISDMKASRCGSIVANPYAKPAVKKIDRVARHAAMSQAWSKDAFLKANNKAGSKPRKSTTNFHNLYAAQHKLSARESEQSKKRILEEMERKKAARPASAPFVAPQDKRRDALRWEVRVRMHQKETTNASACCY